MQTNNCIYRTPSCTIAKPKRRKRTAFTTHKQDHRLKARDIALILRATASDESE